MRLLLYFVYYLYYLGRGTIGFAFPFEARKKECLSYMTDTLTAAHRGLGDAPFCCFRTP